MLPRERYSAMRAMPRRATRLRRLAVDSGYVMIYSAC